MKKDCEGLDEVRLAIFLRDRFIELRSPSSTGRALKKAGWSKKVARRIAKEQCADRAENEETLNSMEMAGFAYRLGGRWQKLEELCMQVIGERGPFLSPSPFSKFVNL